MVVETVEVEVEVLAITAGSINCVDSRVGEVVNVDSSVVIEIVLFVVEDEDVFEFYAIFRLLLTEVVDVIGVRVVEVVNFPSSISVFVVLSLVNFLLRLSANR